MRNAPNAPDGPDAPNAPAAPNAANAANASPNAARHGWPQVVAGLLDIALQAQRSGNLEERIAAHPRAARWLVRRHARLVAGTAGDALALDALAQTAAWMLRWLVTQLRPDAKPEFENLPEGAWLRLPAWRPMLAVACMAGYMQVPDFPRHYRKSQGEPTLDNLCGLWGVGPSTVYRMLERARQTMAGLLLASAADAERRLSLRGFVLLDLSRRLVGTGHGLATWHLSQAARAASQRDAASELWHRWRAHDAAGFVNTLRRHAGELAHAPETRALTEQMAAGLLSPRQAIELRLARSALARASESAELELEAIEQARQVAQDAASPLLLGIVYSALGKFYEQRDGDRAFACYQDSADHLRELGPDADDTSALEHFTTTFVRLAWLYLLRNDPRSRALLDRAEALRSQFRLADEVLGMLEQVWGEYWRRSGDVTRSLEHRHRALNIFERLGDRRSMLAATANVGMDLVARGDLDRGMEYLQRIPKAAKKGGVDAELLVNAYLNLGAAHFFKGELEAAIAHYDSALTLSMASDLRLDAFRARYNLAEACYTRFRSLGLAADEGAGDAYVQDALAVAPSESGLAAFESIRELKATILVQQAVANPDRLLPGETAAHFEEMAEVARHRELLTVPGDARAHARAHLAIARCYHAIAVKERDAAHALTTEAGLQLELGPEFEALRSAAEFGSTPEQQLAYTWKQAALEFLNASQRAAVLGCLLREGTIGKSSYAELAAVAPATASKHLGVLTALGLLTKMGNGPSTRYTLKR